MNEFNIMDCNYPYTNGNFYGQNPSTAGYTQNPFLYGNPYIYPQNRPINPEYYGVPYVYPQNNTAELKDLKDTYVPSKGNKKSTDTADKKDGSNDGKFTFGQALKNLGKGIISPFTAIIKHPIATIATLAGIGLACMAVPVLTPILTVGFGALSLFQLGKSTYKTIKDYKNGEYDKAEKGFEGIGQGIVGTVMTALGLKQSAKIAAESKVLVSTGAKALTNSQKAEIAAQVTKGGLKGALKENLSMFTTKQGLKAIANQFKPSSIKERVLGIINTFKAMKKNPMEKQIEEFKKSPEGIRRAGLTDEQLQAEITAKYNQAFDELGIPKEQRPELVIKKGNIEQGGGYCHGSHTLEVNPESYKAGFFEIDDVMMHEATHCKEALLRAGIPQERVNQIIADDLAARIINGESEKIIMESNFVGPQMMEAPKMPDGMKRDFATLARERLYTPDDTIRADLSQYNLAKSMAKYRQKDINMYSASTKPQDIEMVAKATQELAEFTQEVQQCEQKLSPFIQELKALMEKYPEFQKGFNSPEEALTALEQYSLSHGTRYRIFTNTAVKGVTPKALSPEELQLAEASLKGYVDTIEGNGRIAGINGVFASQESFNQYQFSPEEVLAQQNGNNFVIKNYTAKLNEMRANGTLTPEMEAYLTAAIKKANDTIAYKTKGLEYYKLYTQAANNPADKELAQKVATLEAELKVLQQTLSPEEVQQIQQFINQTWGSPMNVLPAVAILND